MSLPRRGLGRVIGTARPRGYPPLTEQQRYVRHLSMMANNPKHVFPLRTALPQVQNSPKGFIGTNPRVIIPGMSRNRTAEQLVLDTIQRTRESPWYPQSGAGFDPRMVPKPGSFAAFGDRYGFTIHGRPLTEKHALTYRCSLDF